MSNPLMVNARRLLLGVAIVGATGALTGCGAIVQAIASGGSSGPPPGGSTDAPYSTEETSSYSSEPVDPQQADVFEIEIGDCLNDASVSGTVEEVPLVPCSEAHDSEVFGSGTVSESVFPGSSALDTEAENTCVSQFESFTGIPYSESTLGVSWYTPTEGSWESGDRAIDCIIYDPAGQVTGTLAGADY